MQLFTEVETHWTGLNARGVTTDPGSFPGCATTGRGRESHRMVHNLPSVVRVRGGVCQGALHGAPHPSDSLWRAMCLPADPGRQLNGVAADILVRVASGLSGRVLSERVLSGRVLRKTQMFLT